MNPWYFWCCSMTAQKVPRWFHDSPGIICPSLVWWMWCWCGNAAERLRRPEGVNISKGWVRAECMERSHMAAKNTGEQRRMLGMKFYITEPTSGLLQCEALFWAIHVVSHSGKNTLVKFKIYLRKSNGINLTLVSPVIAHRAFARMGCSLMQAGWLFIC